MVSAVVLAVVSALALPACAEDRDGPAPFEDGGAERPAEGPGPGPPPTAPALPDQSAAGTGTLVLAGAAARFTVDECLTGPLPGEPEGAQTLLRVTGSGSTAAGIEFTIQITRFVTGTDVLTFTDTIAYIDTARILQAQRIEVAGQVTDLRDERAGVALLSLRDGGVAGRGIAGPPGSVAGDEGLVGIAVDATC